MKKITKLIIMNIAGLLLVLFSNPIISRASEKFITAEDIAAEALSNIVYGQPLKGSDVDLFLKYSDYYVLPKGQPEITKLEAYFVGNNTLINDSDIEQTLSSASFSKEVSDSVTATTTHGVNLGVSVTANFKIPFVGGVETTVSTEYSFSSEKANTSSESRTYSAPQQDIVVPPKSKAIVTANLNRARIKGQVEQKIKASGMAFGSYKAYYYDKMYIPNRELKTQRIRVFDMNRLASKSKLYKDRFVPILGTNEAFILGEGEYQVDSGTDFTVTVQIVPLDSWARSAGETHSYNVPALVQ